MIESALSTYLNSVASVTALVDTRIYPMQVPQAAEYPAISYERTDSEHIRSMEGPSGLVRSELSIDCWARSYSGAKQLADVVRLALDGQTGTWGDSTIGAVHLLNQDDFLLPAAGNEAQRLYAVTLDVAIWHDETV